MDSASDPVSRRSFLHTSCGAAALLALGFPLAACDSGSNTPDEPKPLPGDGITVNGNTITLDLTGSRASQVSVANGFLYLEAAGTIVLNVDGTTIRAFSSVCPHQGFAVDAFSGGALLCSRRDGAHGSQFSPAGAVVRGPASGPLRAFAVSRSGNAVTITKTA